MRKNIFELIRKEGGRALIIGGAVRDKLLGIESKDIDVEVFGLKPEFLQNMLEQEFQVEETGKNFGVLKLKELGMDISIPRRESKSGLGHKGFEINSDPFMTVKEAAERRDFTINTMSYDPLKGELIDPFNGMKDLYDGILRATSQNFQEDPLRVLRGMQFAARFGFKVAPETIADCKNLNQEELPKERIFEEWRKLLLKGRTISLGLIFLRQCGWIRFYPELQALIGCEQDETWHPEGDVWIHTLQCMDAFAHERVGDDREDLVVGFAVLCHDFGKPTTTTLENGRVVSKGHEGAGEIPTQNFLSRITEEKALLEEVVPLVVNHLKPREFFQTDASDRAYRRLANKTKRLDRLCRVARLDKLGVIGYQTDTLPFEHWFLKRAEELSVKDSAPKPIMMGRHLIEMGLKPGVRFGEILRECYERQLDGELSSAKEGREIIFGEFLE